MYLCMMKNIHSPNLVDIGSWGPEIWPHEYLISPIEIIVNWPGFKQQIYIAFSGAILAIRVAISQVTMNRFM